jgi:hypothetical protein
MATIVPYSDFFRTANVKIVGVVQTSGGSNVTALDPIYTPSPNVIACKDAAAAQAGVVSLGDQTLGSGVKTMDGVDTGSFKLGASSPVTSVADTNSLTSDHTSIPTSYSVIEAINSATANLPILTGPERFETDGTLHTITAYTNNAPSAVISPGETDIVGTLGIESPNGLQIARLIVDNTYGNLTVLPVGDFYTSSKVIVSNADAQAISTIGGVSASGPVVSNATTDSTGIGVGAIHTSGGIGSTKKITAGTGLLAVNSGAAQCVLSYESPAVHKASFTVDSGGNLDITTTGATTSLHSGATQLLSVSSSQCRAYEGFAAPTGTFSCDPPLAQLSLYALSAGQHMDFYFDAINLFNHISAPNAIVMDNVTNSTSSTDGAFQVKGGASVVKDLWVGGTIHGALSGTITPPVPLILSGNPPQLELKNLAGTHTAIFSETNTGALHISTTSGSEIQTLLGNPLHVKDTTASAAPSQGALIVDGGVGVAGALYTGSTISSGDGVIGTLGTFSNTTGNQELSLNNTSVTKNVSMTVDAGGNLSITGTGTSGILFNSARVGIISSATVVHSLVGALVGHTVTVKYQLVGDIVTATFAVVSTNATATAPISFDASSLVPIGLRPAANTTRLQDVFFNTVHTVGLIFVTSAGAVTFWNGLNSPGNFINALNAGWPGFTITWSTV